MAEQILVEEVKDLLPEDSGWDDDKIKTYLDAGNSVYAVLRKFWESRAAKYHSMIDVSEHGSSRSMSRLYDNALKQAEYWDSKVAKEEEDAEEDSEGHATVYLAKRL